MKCKFCGARIGKSEEICPECGKLITSASFEKNESSDPERDLGKNIRFSDCKSGSERLLSKGITAGVLCLISGIAVLYKIGFNLNYIFVGHFSRFVSFALALILTGVAVLTLSIIAGCALRKSFVCVNENGVYGIMPKLFLKADWFKIFYEDITDFKCYVPLRGASLILIKANGKSFLLYGLDVASASASASYIRENLPRKH